MQLEIDCIEWALHKIEVNKIPNDRLESVIRSMIKDGLPCNHGLQAK